MDKRLYRLDIAMGLVLFAIVALTALVFWSFAAEVSNRKDQMSNQRQGQTSSHQISFNLSGTNTFVWGEQIVIDFPTTFTQGGAWATTDFTFTDGVARTIDAVNAGGGVTTVACTNGANNVGVAIDTTAMDFRVIPCGAAFTPSGAGAFITFVIDGVTPNGELTNPPAAGSYIINILDAGGDCTTVGDSCRMSVSILVQNQVPIAANVGNLVCGDGVLEPGEACDDGNTANGDGCSSVCAFESTGGGGGPPPDTTAPVLSNIRVENILTTKANVKWSTSEAANSLVRYGLTASYGLTKSDAGYVMSRTVALDGLSEATVYHYQVCSSDPSNNQSCSPDATFTTADETPPVISNAHCGGATPSSLTFTWNTNENSDSNVDYDLDGLPYINTKADAAMVKSHMVKVTGLTADTTYHYRVRSGDASANEKFTTDATCKTAVAGAPVISNEASSTVSPTSVTITWTTDESATSAVDYGTTTGYGQTESDPAMVTSHSVTLTGLTPNTTYHYQLRSTDADTNESTSIDFTFTTPSDAPVISNETVTSVSSDSATIIWTTNESATSTVNYGTTAAYGQTESDPAMVTSHSVTLTGLAPDTTYHYQMVSVDPDTNETVSVDYTFTTTGVGAPVVSGETSTAVSPTSVTITWTTNEPSTSAVDYGTTTAYGQTESDPTMVTSHSITLTGLTPGTTYHYQIRSTDADTNETTTIDFTFTTPSEAPACTVVCAQTGAETYIVNPNGSVRKVGSDFVQESTLAPGVHRHAFEDKGDDFDYNDVIIDVDSNDCANLSFTSQPSDAAWHHEIRAEFIYGGELKKDVLLWGDSHASFGQTKVYDLTTDYDICLPTFVISNVQSSDVTSTGATVTWNTDVLSSSRVEYGETTGYGAVTYDALPVTGHTVTLSGLEPDTTYNYRVKSVESSSRAARSGNFTFKTLLPDPPVISGIESSFITETGGRFTWETDTPTISTLEYGLDDSYGQSVSEEDLRTGHLIVLNDLTQGTEYHYRIRTEDAYGQVVYSEDAVFTTVADDEPPASVSEGSAQAGDSEVILDWENPTDDDFVGVIVVRSAVGIPENPEDGVVVYEGTDETYTDDTVTNGVTYYYAIFAVDDAGNTSAPQVITVTPEGAADTTPPGTVTGFSAEPGDGQIALGWTNPVDADFQGVMIRRGAGQCPTAVGEGVLAYDDSGTEVLDIGLINGTEYCYAAFSYDAVPNYSAAVTVTATPVAPEDETAPQSVSGIVADTGDGIAQFSWTNPDDPDFAGVRIVRKAGSAPTGINDGDVVFVGLADNYRDESIENGVTYYYAFYTYDPTPNYSPLVVVSVTPVAGSPAPLAPACTDSDGGINLDLKGTVTLASGAVSTDTCSDSKHVREQFCDGGVGKSQPFACGTGFKCTAAQCVPDTFDPTASVCGDSICESNENSLNCPTDCPVISLEDAIEEAVPTVSDASRLTPDEVQFLTTSLNLPLVHTQGNIIPTFPLMSIKVYVPDSTLQRLRDSGMVVTNAFVNFLEAAYTMTPTSSYAVKVATPGDPGLYPLSVMTNYADGTNDRLDMSVEVRPFGRVYELDKGSQVPVSGARVSLFKDMGGGNFGLVPQGDIGQPNPQVTNSRGEYGFIVPPGVYKVMIEANGFRTKESMPFSINDNTLNTDYRLIKKPKKKLLEIFDEDATLGTIVDGLGDQAGYAVAAAFDGIRERADNEFVEEQVRMVTAPVTTAVAVANVASAGAATATAIPYLMHLYSLLAHPFMAIARRRRKQWGVVYNAITKSPVDLAIIRLVDADTGRMVRSAVTDKAGRYFFIVQKGKYRLQVSKAGFVYPTDYMKGERTDARYQNVYQGEDIEVKAQVSITANVPIDPVEKEKTPRRVVMEGIARRFQKNIGLITLFVMSVAVFITPTAFMFGLFGVNLFFYLVFKRFAIGKTPKNWGIVYDKKTRRPLRNAIVRVFESKYNKLLEMQVTDIRGRYGFLVGNNKYFVTYEKPGYEKQQKGPFDLLEERDEKKQVIAEDAKLPRAKDFVEEKKEPAESKLVAPAEKKAKPSAPGTLLKGGAERPEVPAKPGEKPAKPEAPAEKKAAEVKVPWELEMILKGGAKPEEKPAGEAKPEAPAEEKPAEEPKPAEKPAEPAAPAEEKPAGTEVPRELVDLLKGGAKPEEKPAGEVEPEAPAEEKPAEEPKPAEPETPAEESGSEPMPMIGGTADVPLIQDAEHAHPEEHQDRPESDQDKPDDEPEKPKGN